MHLCVCASTSGMIEISHPAQFSKLIHVRCILICICESKIIRHPQVFEMIQTVASFERLLLLIFPNYIYNKFYSNFLLDPREYLKALSFNFGIRNVVSFARSNWSFNFSPLKNTLNNQREIQHGWYLTFYRDT